MLDSNNKWQEGIDSLINLSPSEILLLNISSRLKIINEEYIHQLKLERQSIDYSKYKKYL